VTTLLHPDRLFPTDPDVRTVTRELYEGIQSLPIISPHGHTDPKWFAENQPFANPADLLITPDHYVYRMLYSQGVSLESLGIQPQSGDSNLAQTAAATPETVWRLFAQHYTLFQGTPTRMWLDHVFQEVFELTEPLNENNADVYYDHIQSRLSSSAFLPRNLFERFNIELLATTESPIDALEHHAALKESDWNGRVVTTFRPDPVVDPEFEGFRQNLATLGELTSENTATFSGYLDALRNRRAFFREHGATATVFERIRRSECSAADAELFRAQMLTEMARMSLDDGMVMQIHPGSYRNHNGPLFAAYGRDRGADIPTQTDYVNCLKPLLDRYGNESDLSIILFTLDETAYSRELAPLAGHYPCLKLGPAWWFHDSPEGMRRFRAQTTETAGFYNTAGFNDDTRAFLSIPARHDVSRRIDCGYLAQLVCEHRLRDTEAHELAQALAYDLAKRAYKL